MKQNPETWEAILAGTPLLQMAYDMAEFALGVKAPQMEPPDMMPDMPPPPIGMPPIQPPSILTPPMGGGVPPVLQGQMSPNSLGLPQQGAPGLFGQLTGQPLSPEDELQSLMRG